jgi:hypothetical protein
VGKALLKKEKVSQFAGEKTLWFFVKGTFVGFTKICLTGAVIRILRHALLFG